MDETPAANGAYFCDFLWARLPAATPEQAAEIEKRLQQVLDELFAHPDLPKNEPDLTPVKST